MAKSEHNDGDVLAGRANSFPWPPLLLVACVAAAIVLDRQAGLAWPGLDDWPAQAVGLGFGVIGLTLIVTAIVTLANAGTTIMPHGISTELVTTGPYWRFRNPIYLGEAFMLLGAAELSKNVWFVIAAAVFAGLVTVLQIVPEERHLEARFGDAYRDYKARSRRWL